MITAQEKIQMVASHIQSFMTNMLHNEPELKGALARLWLHSEFDYLESICVIEDFKDIGDDNSIAFSFIPSGEVESVLMKMQWNEMPGHMAEESNEPSIKYEVMPNALASTLGY
jgi:hypothetical protein